MKMTFKTEGAVINYNGVPVEIKPITMEVEMSVQEIAQGGTNTLKMVDSIKEAIKEAQVSAQQAYAQYPRREIKAEPKEEAKPEKVQHWDLSGVWKVMTSTLPTGFDKAGVGSYVYTYECENDNGKKAKTTIKIAFNDSIDMRIYVGETKASFYLYEDAERSWVDGINPTLIDELIDELPEGVREFVRNFVKKVLNK